MRVIGAAERTERPVVEVRRGLARLQWAIAAGGGTAVILIGLAPLMALPAGLLTPVETARVCLREGAVDVHQAAMLIATTVALLVLLRAAAALVEVLRATRAACRVTGRRVELHGRPVTVVPGGRIVAFCVGWLRPRTIVSEATVRCLRDDQLAAVLAHERHHSRRRDPVRVAVRRVLADALFFVPTLQPLRRRHDDICEIRADAAALRASGGDARPLAGALLAFVDAAPAGVGISAVRMDQLAGSPCPPVRVAEIAVTVFAAGLAATLALVAGQAALGDDGALQACAGTLAVLGVAAVVGWRWRASA